jgi:intracellular sulfur oxidation DsrE/DsrF family protein
MNGKWLQSPMARRLFLTRLGAGAGVVGATLAGSPAVTAQTAMDAQWRPARHSLDDWYDKLPGVHRFVFDTSTPEGMGLAIQFAGNFFTANQEAYGLKESELAIVIVARHRATEFTYNDSIWAKYGKQLSEHSEYTDPKTKLPPTVNIYAATEGSEQAGKMAALIKKGVQFAVCGMSTRGISTRIAKANGVEIDSIVKEISANLVSNSRMVPAGVVAVNRAQEHGYSFIHAI